MYQLIKESDVRSSELSTYLVSEAFNQWAAAMQALPAMQEWLAAAQTEQWTIESFEACGD